MLRTLGVFTVDETAGFAAGFVFGFVLSKRKHFPTVADFALHWHIPADHVGLHLACQGLNTKTPNTPQTTCQLQPKI